MKNRASGSTSNELAEYFRITSVPEPFDGVDPLQWWYSRCAQFPQLYRLARNILCILCFLIYSVADCGPQSPGSAVAVERIFSGGRASLKAETIQTLMFVKARLRLARKAIIDLVGEEDN